MSDFRKQIEEDIFSYQERFPHVEELKKEEWAFNYWILDKFFYEEDEIILDKIIDYKDRGIDAYEWYEDTKELFIIQNKYYTTTKIQEEYVKNNFLIIPLAALNNGTYVRCPELQQIYTKNKDTEGFTVHLQIYITNDLKNPKVDEAIKNFNAENGPAMMAEIFYLSDIEEKWYGEPRRMTKQLTATIQSVNNGTILNINNEAYKLDNLIDAKYVYTPISCIYNLMRDSIAKGYQLFEKNIREYLGNKGINKNIYLTLKDKNDRKNFFYYNNGITMICDDITSTTTVPSKPNSHIGICFKVKNPQIVNGCQTVNSIYSALSEYDEDDIENQFKDSFVMLRVLKIDSSNATQLQLATDIVKYNNSQNSIDEKTFVANNDLFQRVKTEFESKGFLLLAKQSDQNTFNEKYGKTSELTKLRGRSVERRAIFGLEGLKKLTDFYIPLEKLLQVVLAFKDGGLSAYTQKKDVLKPETKTYSKVIEFIKSSNITTDVLLDLYLLFLRSEKEKKINSGDGKIAAPISFYLIDGFAKYECQARDGKLISANIEKREKVDKLIKLYTGATRNYAKKYMNKHSVDYIKMIKMEIDYYMLSEERESALDMFDIFSGN